MTGQSRSTSPQVRAGAKHRRKKEIGAGDSNESERFLTQSKSHNFAKATSAQPSDDQRKDENNNQADVGDDVNIKRSIEMKSGIALRSMNNFHKGTNAISLNNYKVSAPIQYAATGLRMK